jgi:hypothetical protein
MTAILRRLPFSINEDEVTVGRERMRIRPYQIILWVSVTPKSVLTLGTTARRFPAILDTGHNHNFSIQRRHVIQWAGMDPTSVPLRGAIREGGRRAELRSFNVWIHPNEKGERDRFADRPAHCVELPAGVAVYPDDAVFPPLPLLGLRALVRGKMHLALDPEHCVVNLRTPDWYTRLFRWLS